jgi:uncharacterized Zn finger protein
MGRFINVRCPECGFKFWSMVYLVKCRQCEYIFTLKEEDIENVDNHFGKSFKNA